VPLESRQDKSPYPYPVYRIPYTVPPPVILISSMVEPDTSNILILVRVWNEKKFLWITERELFK